MSQRQTVLLIEDNPGDARLIREMLRNLPGEPVVLEHVDHLAAGLERIAAGDIDVVLLDLKLSRYGVAATEEKKK